MDINDFRLYSVIVEGGSGVLFQPMNKLEDTYVLTANHNMFGERPNAEDERIIEKYQLDKVNIFIPVHNEIDPIELQIIIGESYFPHNIADITILKIDPIPGYQEIYINDNSKQVANTFVCGYPGYLRIHPSFSNKYTSYEIKSFISENGTTSKVQLTAENKDQLEIKGLSGGGILKIENNYISLIGIQSEVSSHIDNGQIEFVPVKYFEDIINDPKYGGSLAALLPPYMGGFEYIKDEIFNVNAGPDDGDIVFTRKFLQNKANEIINSDITPCYIKDFFKERLLLNERERCKLNNKVIYVTWLEFLTIINIVKSKKHAKEDLEEIFNIVRLLYKDTDINWQASEFLEECLCFNYENLKQGGTVLIKTNAKPVKTNLNHYRIDRKSIIPNITRLKNQFENGEIGNIFIDNASGQTREFVFDQFNFMHFEFLKEFLLVWESEKFKEYNSSNKDELLLKLKDIYGKLFSLS